MDIPVIALSFQNKGLSVYVAYHTFRYSGDRPGKLWPNAARRPVRLQGNYQDTCIANIRKVTKEDIQAAAKKYMGPEKMTVLVVGDEKRFDKPLASFGRVKALDLKKIVEEERGPQKQVGRVRRGLRRCRRQVQSAVWQPAPTGHAVSAAGICSVVVCGCAGGDFCYNRCRMRR